MKFVRFFFSPYFLTAFFAAPGFGGSPAPEKIKLPQPMFTGDTSVEKALQDRHSIRDYPRIPLEISEVSQLLWAAQGITGFGGRRTAPSAGATYPLEVRVVVGNVPEFPPAYMLIVLTNTNSKKIESGDKRLPLYAIACLIK
jgi:hypothetical protein